MHHAMRNAQRDAIGQALVKQLRTPLFHEMRGCFMLISIAESHAPS
jgi:hypothetical protein